MAKTLAEIEKALEERYNGRLDEKKGMTYAAWEDITYAANRIFGPLGWSRTFVETPHREGEGYACVMRVTIEFIDEKGNYDSIVQEAPGYNELSYTRAWTDDKGVHHEPEPMIDTAYKGAYADALKKCLQAFGDAFGLFIGAEAKAEKAAAKASGSTSAYQRSNNTDSRQTAPAGDKRPTEGQMKFLKSLGYNDDDIAGMPFAQWKAVLDNKTRKAGTQPTPKAAPKPVPTYDDVPEGDLPF